MANIHPVSVQIKAVDAFTAPFKKITSTLQSASAPLARMQGQFNALSKKMSSTTGKFQAVADKSKAIGGAMTAGLTLPVVAGAGLAVRAFTEVDDAVDALAIKTGASGKELEGLEQTFNSLAKTAPNGLNDIANTVAGVHTRLGLAGKPLEDFSNKVLKVARMTGVEAETALQMMTKAINDAGAKGPEASKMLDLMFATSQKTGVSIETLGEQMFKFGAPLRALGFDSAKSAALLGSFEKAGVNTELVIGSMRKSLGKMAKAGVDPVKGLTQVTDAIKNAKTVGEATTIAFDVFGAKAGVDMALAIREGRFEVGALIKELQNSDGAIDKTAAKTDGFQEKMTILRNKLTLAGSAIGEKLAPHIEALALKIESLVNWFNSLNPNIQNFILIVGGIAAVLGPLVLVFGFLAGAIANIMAIWPALVVAFTFLSSTIMPALTTAMYSFGMALLTTPIGWIIAGIVALIAVGVLLWKKWDTIKFFFIGLWEIIKNVFSGKIGIILTILMPFIGIPIQIIKHWSEIQKFFTDFFEYLGTAIPYYFDLLMQKIEDFMGLPSTIMKAWEGLKGFFSDLWDSIKAPFEAVTALGIKVDHQNTALESANAKASMSPKQISNTRANGTNVNTTNTEKAHVTVDFTNLPKGTNINQSNTGMNFNLNQGFNLLGT